MLFTDDNRPDFRMGFRKPLSRTTNQLKNAFSCFTASRFVAQFNRLT
jgi:hypothetical protein